MKKYLELGIVVVLVTAPIALFAWQLLSADVGGPGVMHINNCLVSVSDPDYEAHSEACDRMMTATAEASVTPAWWQFWWHPVEASVTPASWQFWSHPEPTTFFSAVTPIPTATP